MADEPAFLLLRAAVTHAADFTDPRIDPMLDRAWQGMLDLDNEAGTTAALGQAMITAHSRADLARLAALTGWADRLDTSSSPVLRLLWHTVAAMHAEIDGDPEAALTHLVQAPVLEVPRALALSTWRFHYHCLNMCGRSGEAADLADRILGDVDDELVRLSGAVARWLDGDPSELGRLRGPGRAAAAVGTPRNGDRVPATAREAFVATALAALIASSTGDESLLPVLPCGDPEDKDNPRDAILACVAQATVAVARGDERAAQRAYARNLARWPVEIRFAERHLRRFLALGYVVNDRLREHWDGVELGPSHLAARTAARALLLARAGDVTAGRAAVARARAVLPAVAVVGGAGGPARGRGPSPWTRAGPLAGRHDPEPAVHRRFREAARSAVETVATGAAQLLAASPRRRHTGPASRSSARCG